MAELPKDKTSVSSAFFVGRKGVAMSVLEKLKHFPFVEHLWSNLLLATIVLSMIFLIVMLLSRALY
jgi:hypothetical protein